MPVRKSRSFNIEGQVPTTGTPGGSRQSPRSNRLHMVAVVMLFAVSAVLIITMETGLLEDGSTYVPTTTVSHKTTPSTITPSTTVTTVANTTATTFTLPPTTVNACGVIMQDFTTDVFTYSHLTDGQINCSLLITNALDVQFTFTSIMINIEQNKTSGAGSPQIKQLLRIGTDVSAGQSSLSPGNSTYLNFNFTNEMFESTIGEYTLEAILTINGITCEDSLFTDYQVI